VTAVTFGRDQAGEGIRDKSQKKGVLSLGEPRIPTVEAVSLETLILGQALGGKVRNQSTHVAETSLAAVLLSLPLAMAISTISPITSVYERPEAFAAMANSCLLESHGLGLASST